MKKSQTRLAVVVMVASVCALFQPVLAQQNGLVVLKNNSILNARIKTERIRWSSVTSAGVIQEKQIAISDIRELKLVETSSSSEAAMVMSYLGRLESPSYSERESAEAALKNKELVTKYRQVIKNRIAEYKSFDAKYRAERILRKFSRIQDSVNPEFDELTLKNGTTVSGGVQSLELEVLVRGQSFVLERKDVRRLTFAPSIGKSKPAESVRLNSQVHLRYESEFARQMRSNESQMLDFTNSPEGLPFVVKTSVETAFAQQGILFLSPDDRPGFVGISDFNLSSITSSPSNGNSIATFLKRAGQLRPYIGTMAIRFCEPGFPARPASVTRFGTSLAKCNHHRDFILEAYNKDNQIIATAEATSQKGVFLGVETNEPIVRIEIKSNPYLENAPGLATNERLVDENFAIDDVCFSPPQPILLPNLQLQIPGITFETADNEARIETARSRNVRVVTVQGEVLLSETLSWLETGVRVSIGGNTSVEIPFEDILVLDIKPPRIWNERKFGAERLTDPTTWHAMLSDRSVIAVQPEKELRNDWGMTLDLDRVVGLFPSFGPARLNQANQYPALVFPTCTIVANKVELKPDRIEWERKALIEAPLVLEGDEDADDSKPHPEDDVVLFHQKDEGVGTYVDQIPSVWYRELKTYAPGAGQLVMVDNQRITLGADTTGQLVAMTRSGVNIKIGGRQQTISWDKVAAIQRPAE